ncbi:MAG TPA: hypothetical protein VKG43_11835 [Acidimicrobiales bacterium]|nr:hypothetical protein [Acidimicrobiales bacterium]
MIKVFMRRGAALVGACALVVAGLGIAGAAAASAAPSTAAGHSGTGLHTGAVQPGVYNLFFNYGSGFNAAGTLTLNADGSYTMSNFCDVGAWTTVKTEIVLGDSCGIGINVGVLTAKTNSHFDLGSAKKPGTAFFVGAGVVYTWYGVPAA